MAVRGGTDLWLAAGDGALDKNLTLAHRGQIVYETNLSPRMKPVKPDLTPGESGFVEVWRRGFVRIGPAPLVLVSALGLLLVGLVGCAVPAPRPVALRVLTYNIHHGEGLDGRVDVERIAAVIRSTGADLVALQEVDQGVARTARRDLPAELAARTGLTAVFSNNFAFQGGRYGNAILTRFPVLTATNRHYEMLRAGEQRGLLQVRVTTPAGPLAFWNTHIDYRGDDAERRMNVRELVAHLHATTGPVILAGDFNDLPGSPVHQELKTWFVDAWEAGGAGPGATYPAAAPQKRIDYLWLAADRGLSVRQIWVVDSLASDHRPVVADLEWLPRGGR